MPLFSLALGGIMFAAYAIGGDAGEGVFAFGVMAAVDLKASAFAGLLLIAIVIGGFMYEIADGDDGSPFAQLGAIAGVAYIAAVAFLRWRS